MIYRFLCSTNEKKIYDRAIGLETIISINGIEDKCVVKSVDDYGNTVVEINDDSPISKNIKEKLGLK